MFTNRFENIPQPEPAPTALAGFTVVPISTGGGFDALQMLYQRAYEDAQQAQAPRPSRELFSVMN